MPSRKNLHSLVIVLLVWGAFTGGCTVNKVPPPPYFKDIYESSRTAPAAEKGSTPGSTKAEGGDPKIAVQPVKPPVKIIVIPNPQVRETVTADAEKTASQPVEKQPGTAPAEEPQKTQELSVQAAAGDVQVVVENMPLYDFANLIFGEILKLNYTITQDVQSAQEKITLNMNRKMPGKEFFPFAVDLLRKNNLELKDESGVLYVRRKQQNVQEQVAVSADIHVGNTVPSLPAQKRITLIVSSSYVPISQILQIVRQLQLISGDVRMEAISGSPSIALSGTIASLQKVMTLFNQLDRMNFVNRDINLVYFDYINVLDFDKKIREVLPMTGIPIARYPGENGLITIPFEKINALLLISQQKEWLETVLSWKEKLDTVESLGDETQLFVYHPKNRPATELVDVLRAVASGGNVPSFSGTSSGQRQPAPPQQQPATGVATAPGKGFNAILDKGRNAVIISASPANYKLIRNILVQIDTPPRQVLLEASIIEVTLADNLQYGVEWLIKHKLTTNNHGTFDGTIRTLGGLALGGSGLGYAVTQLGGDFTAQLNMYAKTTQINVLSTPHIATLDGMEASINVGTEVPIVVSEASASDIGTSTTPASGTAATTPSVLRSIQYRTTGVILRVKPTISSDGTLTIDISQELSEPQTNTASNIDSPMILNRSIKTTLSVKSGETVLLGGLISNNKSRGEHKVPFFGDIPLIGNLFKTTSIGETKTELIVQITPYILNDLEQLDEITRKFKDTVLFK